jgi:kumamolisin
MDEKRVNLVGSERQPVQGGSAVGPVPDHDQLLVTVEVRRQGDPAERDAESPPLTREEFAARYGASAADLLQIRQFAERYGLQVVSESAAKRTVQLSGTNAQMRSAFGVDLDSHLIDGGMYHVRSGPLTIPAELDGIITAVLGLDDRPQTDPKYVRRSQIEAHAGGKSYAPNRVADLYGFPASDGGGQAIAIIELGGGFAQDDLDTYFAALGLPTPTITAVPIDGAANAPGVDSNADGEVMLDVEVVGAVSPGATQSVYFAPNSDMGFLDAIKSATHDGPVVPAAISISWGSRESTWTAQALQSFEQAFVDSTVLGITVCVAAGDNGSTDGSGGPLEVDFPASAPHALGCGGTRLDANGSINSEVVWNNGGYGTGGGVSAVFAKPTYQAQVEVPTSGTSGGRGVPDVAGDADPATGYVVRVDGSNTVIGGTSAVAPLWAGLIARLASLTGHQLGFINPAIYSPQAASAFNDITVGSNDTGGGGGQFQAAPGWDACTGMGSPRGEALLGVFGGQVAGGSSAAPPTQSP